MLCFRLYFAFGELPLPLLEGYPYRPNLGLAVKRSWVQVPSAPPSYSFRHPRKVGLFACFNFSPESLKLSHFDTICPHRVHTRISPALASWHSEGAGSIAEKINIFSGSVSREEVLRISIRGGDLDEEKAVHGGSDRLCTAPRLQLDPIWDPLREHSRFGRLLEKYSEKQK